MRKSRFTEEQITMALRQAEAGTAVEDICRKLGVSEATFYRWKKRYGDLGVAELRELRQRRELGRRACEAYQVSERRACLAAGVARSSVHYRSVRPSQEPLRPRIQEICAVRVRAGYRQVHVLLWREGW